MISRGITFVVPSSASAKRHFMMLTDQKKLSIAGCLALENAIHKFLAFMREIMYR